VHKSGAEIRCTQDIMVTSIEPPDMSGVEVRCSKKSNVMVKFQRSDSRGPVLPPDMSDVQNAAVFGNG